MTTFDDGDLHIDFAQSAVTIEGQPVALPPKQYLLLVTLVRHEGETVSFHQLIESVWDEHFGRLSGGIRVRSVVSNVLALRHKLSQHPEDQPIEMVESFGFRYRRRSR